MINTLLFSNNSKITERISKVLNKKEFHIQVKDAVENSLSYLDDAQLILIDITGKNSKDKTDLKNTFEVADKKDIAKLILLDFKQTNFLFKSEIKFDDMVFCPQIESELAVRIKAVLLKRHASTPKNSILVDRLMLNLDKYELSVNGTLIELTFKEFELLKILIQNQNKVFTRNKLLSTVWDYDFYGGSRTVDVHIRRLRSKIPAPYNLMLKTIRNVGYMFSPQI
jgi:two-component system alkaline phosphatase synthesis response regulator PhoP